MAFVKLLRLQAQLALSYHGFCPTTTLTISIQLVLPHFPVRKCKITKTNNVACSRPEFLPLSVPFLGRYTAIEFPMKQRVVETVSENPYFYCGSMFTLACTARWLFQFQTDVTPGIYTTSDAPDDSRVYQCQLQSLPHLMCYRSFDIRQSIPYSPIPA
jgi:hypothetical protein